MDAPSRSWVATTARTQESEGRVAAAFSATLLHDIWAESEVLCLATWVTVLHQDIGDSSGILGGDTSAAL